MTRLLPLSLFSWGSHVIPVVVLLVCLSHTSPAQSFTISGHIKDTVSGEACPMASVILLTTDSTLLGFTRSRRNGVFSMRNIRAGRYIVFITHPSYGAYTRIVIFEKDSVMDLGLVILPEKADTLPAVIVTPRSLLPRMHGDTVEFEVSNVKTRINATVEELLRRLPGLRVDADGTITYNGKKVDRLMVNGVDFFGGTPSIVTQNFNADMIAKVQILEKRSRQAEFTGVDDGSRTTTLNLTMKEDSKRGWFSKIEAGKGAKDIYNTNGIFGNFKDRRQFAVLGMMANTGSTGFSGNTGSLGSGFNIAAETGDALGASAGKGIPRTAGAGIHYADLVNEGRDYVGGNYNYGDVSTRPYLFYTNRQILPHSVFTQQQNSNSVNSRHQHTLDANYEWSVDSLTGFSFSMNGNNSSGTNDLYSNTNSMSNDTLLNEGLREIHSRVKDHFFQGHVMWRLRSRKKRTRVFSAAGSFNTGKSNTEGFIYAINKFHRPDGSIQQTDTTDQRKVFSNDNFAVNGSLNYTEPVWKGTVLAASFGVAFTKNLSNQSTYDRGNGRYQDPVDSLSNRYRNDVVSQQLILNLQGQGRMYNYTIGGTISYYNYLQRDLVKEMPLQYRYFNFAPRIDGRYSFSPRKNIGFGYDGSTRQPSIQELQPVQNNNDPLHITLGNPRLRPSFSHQFRLDYNTLKPIALGFNLAMGLTSNGISTRTYTDSLGRQISQAVNVDGAMNGNIKIIMIKVIRSLDIQINTTIGLGIDHSVNYVNEYLSHNNGYNVSGGISISKFVANKLSILLNTNWTHIDSRSSVNALAATSYWTQNHNLNLSWFFNRLSINTNAIYSWRQKLSPQDRKNRTFLWNASVTRDFFKNRLTARCQINDILAQNTGISWMTSANQTTQSTFNILGRYWMLGASYRLVHHRKSN